MNCILYKSIKRARCRWLTPIILATQETEIRRIAVWSQPGQISRIVAWATVPGLQAVFFWSKVELHVLFCLRPPLSFSSVSWIGSQMVLWQSPESMCHSFGDHVFCCLVRQMSHFLIHNPWPGMVTGKWAWSHCWLTDGLLAAWCCLSLLSVVPGVRSGWARWQYPWWLKSGVLA
jgi:hypothetical protein